MGVDITGWVEVTGQYRIGSRPPEWTGVISVRGIAGRNYSMFALLFDVRNYFDVATPFAHRGAPDDVSEQSYASLLQNAGADSIERAEAAVVNPSWLTWREIQSLPWDEESHEELEDTLHLPVDWSVLGADTAYEYTAWEGLPEHEGLESILRRKIDDPQAVWETFYRVKKHEFRAESGVLISQGDPDKIFQLQRRTWRDQQGSGWQMLFKLMATLAEEYDEDHVRLVGWFVTVQADTQ